MNCAIGLTFCLIVVMVCGALADHSWAGVHINATIPPRAESASTRISTALKLRGTCILCSASTGAERTRPKSNPNASGIKATCATYSRTPKAPHMITFPVAMGRDLGTNASLSVIGCHPYCGSSAKRIAVSTPQHQAHRYYDFFM